MGDLLFFLFPGIAFKLRQSPRQVEVLRRQRAEASDMLAKQDSLRVEQS